LNLSEKNTNLKLWRLCKIIKLNRNGKKYIWLQQHEPVTTPLVNCKPQTRGLQEPVWLTGFIYLYKQ
jgi:hypothetical protein